jgi:hypothetical protein
MITRRFNHDIRLEDDDRAFAASHWSTVTHLLVNEPLITVFRGFDGDAKRDKRLIQWLGTASIVLMLVALCGAVIEVRDSGRPPSQSFLAPSTKGTIAISALFGLLASFAVSRYGPFRRRWLKNRFVTECLRIWHFRQMLDTQAIADSLQSDAKRYDYITHRDASFAAFLNDLDGTVGQKLDLLRDSGTDPITSSFEVKVAANPAGLQQLFEAYSTLRIAHQLEFAVYKLSPDDSTFLGISLIALLSGANFLAASTLAVALVLTLAGVLWPSALLPLLVSVLAIFGVAVRAWRDGLALKQEQEHYEDMKHRFETLKLRWLEAPDDSSRLRLSPDVEQAVLEELRSFLRIYEDARFVF